MAGLINWRRVSIPASNPDSNHVYAGVDSADGILYLKDSAGVVSKFPTLAQVLSAVASAVATAVANKLEIGRARAASAAETSTASTTFVDLDSMTVTAPSTGKFAIMFSSSCVNSGNGADRMRFIINVNGSDVAETERRVGVAGGAGAPVILSDELDVTSGQIIKVRYRSTAGTTTVYERSLRIQRTQ